MLTKSSKFIEYMKIHLISLEQDLHDSDKLKIDFIRIEGEVKATRHLLSVATDIMNDDLQEKGY